MKAASFKANSGEVSDRITAPAKPGTLEFQSVTFFSSPIRPAKTSACSAGESDSTAFLPATEVMLLTVFKAWKTFMALTDNSPGGCVSGTMSRQRYIAGRRSLPASEGSNANHYVRNSICARHCSGHLS